VELSAADEKLLRELTERARTGRLKLTGEGGLLGKTLAAMAARYRCDLDFDTTFPIVQRHGLVF
jgi:hypothetical protein